MLRLIPVHRFDMMLSFLTRQASIALRPIIGRSFAPTASSRRRVLSDSPAATAAAAAEDRRWVMLSKYCRRRPDDDDSSFVADANTVAESRTSKGRRVRVALRCAAPPSSSYLYYDFPESARVEFRDDNRVRVVAAHGELVLLKIDNCRSCPDESVEYFVYRPAGIRRPPSLSLLPVLDVPTKSESVVPASYFASPFGPRLNSGGIGLLRRGESETDLLVVHVDMWYDRDAQRQMAVFCVLRPGMRRWEVMEPVPLQHRYASSPQTGNVICVGDRFLCCVYYYGSFFLLCDMANEASPKVRYASLPPEVTRCSYGEDDNPLKVRRMGAGGDGKSDRVRLVSIHPYCCTVDDEYDDHECCCADPDKTCWHPRFVFTIKTWKMNLISMEEPLEWLEDGEIHGEEIWALPGYEGLPQAIPESAVVCLEKPNVVCFLVSNYHFTRDNEKVWMVHLNISTRTLLSVVRFNNDDDYWSDWEKYRRHVPAEIQY